MSFFNFALLYIYYTYIYEENPLKRLILVDYMLAQNLGSKPGDIGFCLAGLCAGRNGETLYGLDGSCGEVIQIDIRNKQCRTVFDCGDSYTIYDMTSLSGNGREGEILAILIKKDDPSQCGEVWALEETEKMEFENTARCELKTYVHSMWPGVIAGMNCAVAVCQSETPTIHVWRLSEQEAHEFHIPCCECQIVGLCAMENSLGREELFAVTFSNHSIGFFAMEMNGLVKVRDLQLEFTPSGLLWIECKQTLLLGETEWVPDKLCALRVTGREVTKFNVAIDDNQGFDVKFWCAFHDTRGTENGIAIFDCWSNSLKIFDLA